MNPDKLPRLSGDELRQWRPAESSVVVERAADGSLTARATRELPPDALAVLPAAGARALARALLSAAAAAGGLPAGPPEQPAPSALPPARPAPAPRGSHENVAATVWLARSRPPPPPGPGRAQESVQYLSRHGLTGDRGQALEFATRTQAVEERDRYRQYTGIFLYVEKES